MANEWLPRLIGTFQDLFKIGGDDQVSIKNSSGTAIHLRNGDDDAFVQGHMSKAKILGTNAANGVTLTVPSALGSGVEFTLPGTDGATNQVLGTNGSGVLGWYSLGAGADNTVALDFDEGESSPATLLSPPDDARLTRFKVEVSVAAGGGSPTIQIGTSGTPNLYVDTDEVDLLVAGVYIFNVDELLGTSPDDIIITITPAGQTFTVTASVTYTP